MLKLAWLLMALGGAVLLAALVYLFFTARAVPLWVRGAVGAVMLGLLLLIISTILDSVRSSRQEETLKEIKH